MPDPATPANPATHFPLGEVEFKINTPIHPESYNVERRAFERVPMVRVCKVRREGAITSLEGRTTNVSQGGALVCVNRKRPLAAGDRIEVAIDFNDAPVILEDDFMTARVVRVIPIDMHEQAIAIRYEHSIGAAGALRAPAQAA